MKPENWIKWDLDSRSGVKMSIFFSKHGAVGYGMFLVMVEMLYRAKDHMLPIDEKSVEGYASLCKIDAKDAKIILHDLFDAKLFSVSQTHFFSPRIEEELQKNLARKSEISEARRKAAERRWSKPQEENATAMQTDAIAMQNMLEKRREEERREDINNIGTAPAAPISHAKVAKLPKAKREPVKLEEVIFPSSLETEEVRAAVQEWLEHKVRIRDSYKSARSVSTLLKRWDGRGERLVDSIEFSIGNEYKGIFEAPANWTRKGKLSGQEKFNQAAQEIMAL